MGVSDVSDLVGMDLFAGAGGLSYGLSLAGFNMKIGIEKDPKAAMTLINNNENINVLVSDIKKINPLKVIKQNDVGKDEICIIAGGPPCRGFSVSNKRNRRPDNPINNLYLDFFRFVKKLNPLFFLFENVEGLVTLNKGSFLKRIIDIGKKLNYDVKFNVLNAVNYGVPQKRKRIFIIGSKFKADTFFKIDEKKVVTVREALDDLPLLDNGNRVDELAYFKNKNLSNYQKRMKMDNSIKVKNNLVTKNGQLVLERYKYIPQGGNWKNIPLHLMNNYKSLKNCHRWIYYRLKWNEPSIVISNYRKNMLIHPSQDRGLSVREAARLQSFPDNYVFYGNLESQQQQIANAVPPIIAKIVGINLLKLMEQYK